MSLNNSDVNIPGGLNNSDVNIPGSLNNSDVNIPASLNNSDVNYSRKTANIYVHSNKEPAQLREMWCLTTNFCTRFSGTAAGKILHVWTTVAPLNTTQTHQKRSLWLEVAARTFSGRKTCLKWAVGCETHRTVKLLSSVRELRLLVSCSLQRRNWSNQAHSRYWATL